MGITIIDMKSLAYTKQAKRVEGEDGSIKESYPAQYLWDDRLKGFGARIFPSGRKSFIISYRNEANTKRFYTIGNFPNITVDQARKIAQSKLLEASQGNDPQASRQQKKKEMNFSELADQYLEYSKEHKRSFKDDQQRLRDHLLPALGKKKLSSITLSMLQTHMSSLRKKLSDSTVNRCIALVKHMFTMAGRWQIIETSPAQYLTPYKEPAPADIVLSPEQCQRILTACKIESNLYAAGLFQLALLTGRRIGEIRTAKWDDVTYYTDDHDQQRVRLTIRSTKSGEQQHVFLNDMAAMVLKGLPPVLNNPYIIAGEALGKPIQTYAKAWRRILKEADISYFKPHGLRHNYISMLIAAGEPMDVVGNLVGHKNSVTTKKYAHHRPEWLQKSTDKFGEVINFPSTVNKKH